jgi:hypothetical protein
VNIVWCATTSNFIATPIGTWEYGWKVADIIEAIELRLV